MQPRGRSGLHCVTETNRVYRAAAGDGDVFVGSTCGTSGAHRVRLGSASRLHVLI
jgi:hypothetical protein